VPFRRYCYSVVLGIRYFVSKMNRLLKGRPAQVLLYFAAWTLVALYLATAVASRAAYYQLSVEWRHLMAIWLTDAYVWSLLAPFVWFLASRIPIRRTNWGPAVAAHLAFGPVFALVEAALFSLIAMVLNFRIKPGFEATFLMVLTFDFHLDLTFYWLIVALQHAASVYRDYRERETKAAQLELRTSELQRELVQSTLSALRMQLHPHFLFNTLNTIVVLVRQGRTREADTMLTHLSELLRRTLDEWEIQEVPLRTELEYLGLYLDIERVRFRDRMVVEIAMAPETMGALVPSFLLQPVVENAIRHGIAAKSSSGNIVLRSRRRDSMLELQVSDDGPGLPPVDPPPNGVGLTNTRARLQQLYGASQSVELQSSDHGTVATIRIPYHRETDPLL
jgi:two-component system, LytTR family, sensor kinase